MKTLSTVLCLALLVGSTAGCSEEEPILRAYRAESPDQLIGGDVAMAKVGDFILENDRIRVAILGSSQASNGPGIFGGTLVDADLQRPEARYRNGNGDDQFAEMFPFANLLMARPEDTDFEIVDDGSNGRAVLRVSGEGAMYLEALSILQLELLAAVFPNLKVQLDLSTDYIIEPGKAYVKLVSTATRTDPVPATNQIACPFAFECDLECDKGYVYGADGCPACECAPEDVYPLDNFTESTAVFGVTFGDEDNAGRVAGLVAGDFLFFGGQNDLFAPGIGYDEDKAVFDALFQDQDTFTFPLPFDFMAASGGDVSYAFFTANPPGEPDPKVLVPIITSSATAFVTAGVNCSTDEADDEECDKKIRWSWERYFAIGKGDVASVRDIVHEVRGTPVGRLEGVVLTDQITPEANAHVFVFADPDPGRVFVDVHALAEANIRSEEIGTAGVLNAIHADVGNDPVEDGDFSATMPEGDYIVVATNEAHTATSPLYRVSVKVGETTVVNPIVPAPASVRYRVTDAYGNASPAKLSFIPILEDGTLAKRDGLRRVYLGEGRLGDGLRHLALTATGDGEVDIEPGRYRLIISRGPEFSISQHDIEVASGKQAVIHATLRREIDTSGWIAGDFHLHAEPSFDSGMKLTRRVTSAVTEGLELAVSTDHDIVTDYKPTVNELNLQNLLQTAIGVELSTLELGHFTAFPLAYDALVIPDHRAPEWACADGPDIMAILDEHFEEGKQGVKMIAHPRDGFIGYIDQIGVNVYDQTRELGQLSTSNVLFREATCEFDAMEVFNSKRFDLIRTPTNREVILYNLCYEALGAAETQADLDAACPELVTLNGGKPLAECPEDERIYECRQRHRRRAAYLMAAEILTRTKEEQELFWTHEFNEGMDDRACDPARHAEGIDPEIADKPCGIHHPGTYDDWLKWLDAGLNVTLTAASDSHGLVREPGMPRTLVESDAAVPPQIDPEQIAIGIRDGRALPTYGPFINASVAGATPGETASISGETFELSLRVQTASWFGVDQIEVYVGGLLAEVIEVTHGPEPIVDYEGTITLPTPAEDSFVGVIAVGTSEENLLSPVYLEVAFGELQLPRVASLAFATLPKLPPDFIDNPPPVPDFFPIFPMAATNAILLDVDGDGEWSRPGMGPAFCPRACLPPAEGEDPPEDLCPDGQRCLEEELVCGIEILGECKTGPPGTGQVFGAMAEQAP